MLFALKSINANATNENVIKGDIILKNISALFEICQISFAFAYSVFTISSITR